MGRTRRMRGTDQVVVTYRYSPRELTHDQLHPVLTQLNLGQHSAPELVLLKVCLPEIFIIGSICQMVYRPDGPKFFRNIDMELSQIFFFKNNRKGNKYLKWKLSYLRPRAYIVSFWSSLKVNLLNFIIGH